MEFFRNICIHERAYVKCVCNFNCSRFCILVVKFQQFKHNIIFGQTYYHRSISFNMPKWDDNGSGTSYQISNDAIDIHYELFARVSVVSQAVAFSSIVSRVKLSSMSAAQVLSIIWTCPSWKKKVKIAILTKLWNSSSAEDNLYQVQKKWCSRSQKLRHREKRQFFRRWIIPFHVSMIYFAYLV